MRKSLLGALVFSFVSIFASQQAMAETVNFSGSYPADACQFSSPNSGSMGVNLSSPLIWSTQASGGNAASVVVNYIGQPTLTLAAVTQFDTIPGAVPSGTNFNTRGYLSNNGQLNSGAWWDTGSKSIQLSNSYSFDTLYVDLTVAFTGSPVPGNYTASTTVTCQ